MSKIYGSKLYQRVGQLLTRYNEISNSSSWSKLHANDIITDNALGKVAPSGKRNMTSLVGDSNVAEHGVYQAIASSLNTGLFEVVVYAQKGNMDYVHLNLIKTGGASVASAWFNLSTGLLGTATGTGWTFDSYKEIGDIIKCVMRGPGTAELYTLKISSCNADNTANLTGGDGATVNTYIWKPVVTQLISRISDVADQNSLSQDESLRASDAGGLLVSGFDGADLQDINVSRANKSRTSNDHVLLVQPIDATGAVITGGAGGSFPSVYADEGATAPVASLAVGGVDDSGNQAKIAVTHADATHATTSHVLLVQPIDDTGAIITGGGSGGNVNLDEVGGTATSVGSGTADAGTLRVAPATDVIQRVSKDASANATGNRIWTTSDQDKIGGAAVDLGAGAAGSGTQRVIVATDDPNLADIHANTDTLAAWDASGKAKVDIQAQTLTALKVSKDANANTTTNRIWTSADVDKIGGVAPNMGAGNVNTGTQRVTIATDDANLADIHTNSDTLAATASTAATVHSGSTPVLVVQPVDATGAVISGGGAGGNVNLDEVGGASVDVGAGNAGSGTQRVSISTDDVNLAAINTSAAAIAAWDDGSAHAQVDIAAQSLTAVKVSKDASANSTSNRIFVQANMDQVGGVTVDKGAGTVGTGTQRVTIGTDDAMAVDIDTLAGTVNTARVCVSPIVGQQGQAGGSGTISSATARITIATDDGVRTDLDTIASTKSLANTTHLATAPVLLVQPIDDTGAIITGGGGSGGTVDVIKLGGQAINLGTGTVGTGTQRVTIATDDAVKTDLDTVAGWDDGSGHAQVDLAVQSLTALKISKDANANTTSNRLYVSADNDQIGGATIDVGSGNSGTGTQRVVISTNDPNLSHIHTNTDTLAGVVTSARAAVNPISGQAGVSAGAGAVDATTQRTTLASDDPAVALLGTIDTDTGNIASDTSDLASTKALASDSHTGSSPVLCVQPIDASGNIITGGSSTVDVDKLGGNSIDLGAGAVSTGTQRTTLASDDPAVALLGTIDADTGSIATDAGTLAGAVSSARMAVNPISGQAGVSAGAGAVDATTQRTTLASDDPAVALLGTIDTDTGNIAGDTSDLASTVSTAAGSFSGSSPILAVVPLNASGTIIDTFDGDANVVELGGNAIDLGAGAVSTGTQRITLASDDPAVASLAVLDDMVIDPANTARAATDNVLLVQPIDASGNIISGGVSSVTADVEKLNGNTIDLGEGVISTGTQRVTLATDDDLTTAAKAIQTATEIMDDWDASDRCKVSPIASQNGVEANEGVITALTQRVTLATDDDAVTHLHDINSDTSAIKTAVEIMDDWDETNRCAVNLISSQSGISAGSGAVAANTPRVTLASDDPAVASLSIMDDWDDSSDNCKVNINAQSLTALKVSKDANANSTTNRIFVASDLDKVNGAAIDIGAGNASTGTQRVSISSDDVNLSAIKTAVEVIDDWDESDRCKVNIISGQAGVAAGAGAVGATVQRMTLASDDPAVTSLSVLDDWDDTSDNCKVNINAQSLTAVKISKDANANATGNRIFVASNTDLVNGAAVNVGAGNAGTGTQRVSISTDDVNLAAINTNAATLAGIVTSSRAAVNLISGQAGVAAGAGTVGATVQRMTLASDDPAVTSLQIMDDWDESDRAKVNLIVGQAGIAAGAGAVGATVPRVTLASDDPAVASLSVLDDWDQSDRCKVNIALNAGVSVDIGAGNASTGTARVSIATDDVNLAAIKTAIQVIDNYIGTDGATAPSGVAVIAGVDPATGYAQTLQTDDAGVLQIQPAVVPSFEDTTNSRARVSKEISKGYTPTKTTTATVSYTADTEILASTEIINYPNWVITVKNTGATNFINYVKIYTSPSGATGTWVLHTTYTDNITAGSIAEVLEHTGSAHRFVKAEAISDTGNTSAECSLTANAN